MICARNIITANFSGGTSATTAPLWQWDYGQVLCITGIEDLPAAFEVHFSTNRAGGVSTTAVGADGQVTIPNVLLTIGKNLNAWIYLSDSEGEGETEYSILIPVKARPMPETYDTEASGEFDDVVRQVSEYAETAQTAADNAGASASAAAASADSAEASATAAEAAKTAAETAQGKAEDAQAAAETAAQTATEKAQQTAQDAAQAAQSKADAESAAQRAEAAQTGAESAKTDAETVAQGAADSASAASASATEAGQAASAAAQSATAAAGSATTAQGAAQTATAKAGEASASATAAAASETAAQTAQTAAETAAGTATASAATATTKAGEAAQSASSAAASEAAAEAAATRAETAAATLTVDDALSDVSENPVQNKVITGEVTQLKSAIDRNKRDIQSTTNYGSRIVNDGQFVPYYVNSGIWGYNADSLSAVIYMTPGYSYTVFAKGTHNRYRIYASNSIAQGATPTLVYQTDSIHTATGDSYTYSNSNGYKYLLCFMNYSATQSIEFSVTEVFGDTSQQFAVNNVQVLTAEESSNLVNKAILDSTSYSNIYDGVIYSKSYNSSNSKLRDDGNGRMIIFDVKNDLSYQINVSAILLNRYIVYGSLDGETYTEIYRVQTSDVTSNESHVITNSNDYASVAVMVYYGSSAALFDGDISVYEFSGDTLPQFTDNGVSIYTKDQIDKDFSRFKATKYTLEYETLKFTGGITAEMDNLCLIAYKMVFGAFPNYQGFLLLDATTNKFYYADSNLENITYVFDWDMTLSSNVNPQDYLCTITVDGDVVFLRKWARENPIIYPASDYASPVCVNFGDDPAPYGFLESISCVQFADGSFVFGEYAKHSLAGEQANDRRNIWRVTKPYTSKSSWSIAHSFKHVYYESSVSDEPNNEIGHIHAIVYDWYADRLYCSTGDIDRHCRVWVSTDKGISWSEVASNGQKYRALGMVFTENAAYWATDSFYGNHNLWKVERDSSNILDFTTITLVCSMESPIDGTGTSNGSQATYGMVLFRNPKGILFLERAEPRSDNLLDITFYSFDDEKLYCICTLGKASDLASLVEPNRNGLPNQCFTDYQPDTCNYAVTGGGQKVRPNTTDILHNSATNYVGVIKMAVRLIQQG